MKFSLDTKIIKPENNNIKNAVILLHGYGGDGNDISAITLNWKRFLPETIFLCPNGHEVCPINQNGFQWFDLEKDDLDYILVSVGGGGLISGVGSIIRQKFPKCKIIGIEPLKSNGMTESLKKGFPLKKVKMDSIADSLSPPLHMEYSFNICKNVIQQKCKYYIS